MTEKVIPDGLKIDTWRLFEQAMSPDPAFATQYAVKTVTFLKIAMKIGGITEYDTLLNDALVKARMALFQYTSDPEPGHEGESLQTVSEAMGMVGDLLYDDRFTIREKNAFSTIGFVSRE